MVRHASVLLLCLFSPLVVAQTFTDATNLLDDPAPFEALGAAIIDLNGDDRADIYRAGRWYLNEGPSGFTNARSSLGIETDNEWGAVFGDFDNDGRVDVYIIGPFPDGPVLYNQQANGQFVPVPNDGGIAEIPAAQGSIWFDFDQDGNLDLFVADDFTVHRLFRNLGNGQFEDASSLVALPYERQGYGAAAGDFDNDGDPDILLGACANTTDRSRNVLFRNDGSMFTDIAPSLGLDNERLSWGTVWLDYNNDGWLDAFIANSGFGGMTNNLLYRNDGAGGFDDVSAASGVEGGSESNTGVSAADFDNDGWIDLLVPASNAPPHLWHNNQDGTFTDLFSGSGLPSVESFTVAVGDVNGDGWIDVFLPSQDGEKLYLNDGGSNHWLQLKARGGVSNRLGVGARIEVETAGLSQIREITAGDGVTSQNHALSAHFGLGDATTATVTVRWPSGIVDEFNDVAADVAYVVTEDGAITPVGTEPAATPTAHSMLRPPSPNPASSTTTLRYDLASPGRVRLALYDALGREVALLSSGFKAAGSHIVRFDGTNLPAGVYVVRLSHGAGAETRTLTFIH